MNRPQGMFRDASASVADLGVLVPLVTAITIHNGLDIGTVLVGFGLLYMASGLYFRVPVPVQPIKAAAAIAIARDLSPETIAAAGLLLGVILLVIGATALTAYLQRAFVLPIVRGLQLGVGLILVRSALGLLDSPTELAIAVVVTVALVVGARRGPPLPLALPLFIVGIVVMAVAGGSDTSVAVGLWNPELAISSLGLPVLVSALTLLVIPQIPLTIGNAVVAVSELEQRYYPDTSRNATARRFALSTGIANVLAGTFGAMPMCHGSGGLTAHYRAGARTFRMNLFIGGALLTVGLFFGPTALALLALLPASVLAGALAFTGLFHSSLVADMRGADLWTALAVGVVGSLTTNLALGLVAGVIVYLATSKLPRRGAVLKSTQQARSGLPS